MFIGSTPERLAQDAAGRSRAGIPAAPLVALPAILVVACAVPTINRDYYAAVNSDILSGDFREAVERIEKSRELYGDDSALLYHMDAAMALHLAGMFDRSNRHVQAASDLADLLFTKSVSRQAASFLTSDASLPYRGEPYELVFLNVLGALNYAAMGMRDDAAVEARRLDARLAEIARTYPDSVYRDDPFARYVSGLVFEDAGELNDAWVSYSKAVRLYSRGGGTVPTSLVVRAASVCRRLGFLDELDALASLSPRAAARGRALREDMGRLIVVQYAGLGPVKVERRIEVTLAQGLVFVQSMEVGSKDQVDVSTALSAAKSVASDQNIVVAFPRLSFPRSGPPELDILARNGTRVRSSTEVLQDYASIAGAVFEENLKKTWGRTIARAVVKFLLAIGAQAAGEAAGGKKYGWLTGLLAGATTRAVLGASEHADTRIWGTIPGQVRMAVMDLPSGLYSVQARGRLAAVGAWTVRVKQGRSAFVFVRTR